MMFNDSIPQILLMYPQYSSNGDTTRLIHLDGEQVNDGRGIRSLRTALCRQYAVDYRALRALCQKLSGPGLTPLLLAPNYTLVPVKTRNALVAGDPCYGYINLAGVQQVKPLDTDEYRSVIVTKLADIQLPSITAAETITQNLRRAKLLQQQHWQIHSQKQVPIQRLLEILLTHLSCHSER